MGGKRGSLAAAAVVALLAGILPAIVAFADPAGCRVDTTAFGINGQKSMHAGGEASCSGSYGRTLRVEIKHDINFRPDALVAANTDSGTKSYYKAGVDSCDNGNYATYYGRTFFTTNTTYHDSDHHKWHVC